MQRELEKLREAGQIGGSLDAEVDIWCTPQQRPRFAALGAELRFVTITSAARVHESSVSPAGAVPAVSLTTPQPDTERLAGVWLAVKPSEAVKCQRCWHHVPDVGSDPQHPEICGRCAGNIGTHPEERRHA